MDPYERERQQVVEACRLLVEQGYLAATGGNVSLRLADREGLAITPSNLDYGRMVPGDVCILDLELNPLDAERKPSVESSLHAAVYQARPDVHAIVHTHQVYASALALIKTSIPALFDEQARFLGRSVDVIPYAPSGTGLLRKQIARHVRDHHNAYILQNHGAICLGHDMERAVNNVEILEKCSLAYLLALCTERPVSKIPLPVREIAFARLRKDQKRLEREETEQ
ncbi:MAG: class II aldolase/adducin family protein [Anaerolineae bacterium]|jgi:ribulose-5-phosphate 4-epimerase/fuculose-1-phosphate aldolase|nr:class II aldolase/adducin family protein [Anaerolineae bacterium]MDX9832066.1 class II aldolase/adducin family protein [Anaerolineae bacterium]